MRRFFNCWRSAFALCVFGTAGQVFAAGIITNVVETGGDNEATDTITAKYTGNVFPVSVANEPIPGAAIDDSYTVTLFGDLAPAFVDRNHRYTNTDAGSQLFPIPSYLLRNDYIMSGNDNRDNAGYMLDVTVASDARVYLLIDQRLGDSDNLTPPTFDATHMQWVMDEGWSAVYTGANRTGDIALPDEVGLDEGADGGINQWYAIYSKDFAAGTFQLKQADNAGQNMYGVVVSAVPEPSSLTLFALGALGLRRRKR